MSKRLLIAFIVVDILLGLAVYRGYTLWNAGEEAAELTRDLREKGTTLFPESRPLSRFDLVDSRGEAFTNANLTGKWSLVFFGFTHCPDICPTTMAELADLKAQLVGTEAGATQVIMVSVDPARDTPERLAEYVPYFHPEFLGVTGDFPAILSFAQRLNAPFRKVSDPNNGYQMEHSANVALMNPRGDYHGFFRAPLDVPKMRVTLRSTQYLWEN